MMVIKRNKGMVFVLCLILLIPLFFVVTAKEPNKELVKGAKITTILNVKAYHDDGTLFGTRIKEDDLLLNNFRSFWITYFDSATTKTVDLKDTGNSARTIVVHKVTSAYANTFCDSASGTANKGGYMSIGSGTTVPTQTDYNIETIYGSWVVIPATYPTWDVSTGNVAIQATFAITGNIAISESALAVQWIPSAGTTEYKLVMFRDTFAGINCVNGDTVVVTLTINLSVSYNRNFGIFLSGMFFNVADGVEKTLTMYDLTGSGRTVYIYSTGNEALCYTNYLSYAGMIGHGTGTTAESRTTNTLTTQTDSYSIIASLTISGSDLVIYGDILCGANRALRENNIIVNTRTGATSQFMFVRTLYNQVDIVSGHSARHTLTFDW